MGALTTHILDTSGGRPAAGVAIRLYRLNDPQKDGAQKTLIHETHSNDDGRCDAPLLEGEGFLPGVYELVFAIGAYFDARGVALPEPKFLDEVVLRVGIADRDAHYHVPLLVSPFGYSTYRGS